nr:glutamate--tRNA ligase family protein [Lewinella sp. W8]
MARIAPTPSGYLHEGNVANFLLNARLAGEEGGLLLRIDDMDRSRFREVYLEDIFRVLDHVGIHWTQGPRNPEDFHAHWSQRFRMAEYHSALAELRHHPLVFACPCSRRELQHGEHAHHCLSGKIPLESEGVAWRINTRALPPQTLPNRFGETPFVIDLHQEAADFVIRKKDGRPSYQVGSLVDDLHFGVTHVARGEDLLPSTAAQSVLAELLGVSTAFSQIYFVHHPLLRGADGEKLSKSAGARGESLLEDAGFDLGPIQHWVDRLIEGKG